MISCIIVSYNDRVIMNRCLSTLSAQLTQPGDEIIVVDNGSTDGVLEDLRERAAQEAAEANDPKGSPGGDNPGDFALPDVAGAGRKSGCRFRLIENGENAGFPVGCNIGFAAAAPGNDIFLLNNDAVPAEGALENLREALYSADDVGAVGAVSNNALEQIEPGITRDTPLEEALRFGERIGQIDRDHAMDPRGNAPVADGAKVRKEPETARNKAYEYRSRLTGFAVLLKRTVVELLVSEDGVFLDPRFSPGYFEDEDLGVRVALAGYRQILCHNAFIYHKGGTGFTSHPEAMERGRQKFIDKWGFDCWAYIGILDDYEQAVQGLLAARAGVDSDRAGRPEERRLPKSGIISTGDRLQRSVRDPGFPLRILEPDCGMGVNLAHLQYRYPGSTAIGIERDPQIARIAATLIDVIGADPEEALRQSMIPGTPEAAVLVPHTFDLIFAWDACSRSQDPHAMRVALRGLLKPEGRLIE